MGYEITDESYFYTIYTFYLLKLRNNLDLKFEFDIFTFSKLWYMYSDLQ